MNLQITTNSTNNSQYSNSSSKNSATDLPSPNNGENFNTHHPLTSFNEDIDSSACSTPYVSAPSSPGRGGHNNGGFFYSAPASPMHFAISSTPISKSTNFSVSSDSSISGSFEFDFSAKFVTNGSSSPIGSSMSSADELFLNGKIRPMKLSTHLQRPQVLSPLLDLEEEEGYKDVVDDGDVVDEQDSRDIQVVEVVRGRDLRLRDKSLRRRTRSLSPLRNNPPFQWHQEEVCYDYGQESEEQHKKKSVLEIEEMEDEEEHKIGIASISASSSRSSSAGRSSKRWVFLKEFLYRSKSEGRSSNYVKFWSSMAFSPAKEKKPNCKTEKSSDSSKEKAVENVKVKQSSTTAQVAGKKANSSSKKPVNGVGKRRIPPSPHELHYTANRAQAEEMRKKTFLPYKQGLLGCLGFSSKGYGAMNGFARALNPVYSR